MVLDELEGIRENLEEIKPENLLELTADESRTARGVLSDISDLIYEIKKGW